ncbi:MAG: SDR family oxidoreductase [Verrucomicrobiota bacterium]
MKTLVIGANGGVGRQVVKLLAESGQPVRAMVRSESQRPALTSDGAEVVVADLEQDFAHAFEGCGACVFTAGSGGGTGGEKTLLVDLWAALKSYEFAHAAGCARYVMVSALRADNPDFGPAAIRHYLVAKKVADDYLRDSPLDWTCLRPGRLTDESGTGRIQFHYDPSHHNNQITRADVAATVVAVLGAANTIGKRLDLLNGEMPIADAVAGVTESQSQALPTAPSSA